MGRVPGVLSGSHLWEAGCHRRGRKRVEQGVRNAQNSLLVQMWTSKVIMKIHVLLEWAYKLGRLRPVRGQKGEMEADNSPVDKDSAAVS